MTGPARPLAHPLSFVDVLAVAVPMTLGYLTTPLVGLVAIAVVGTLGDPVPIGGVALGSVACDLVFSAFYFLRAGTTGFTAQAHGRGDVRECRAVLLRGLAVAVAGGLAVALFARLLLGPAELFFAAEPAVGAAMRAYAEIRLWGAPLTLVDYVILGWLLGRGRAGTGLALQTLLNGVHVGLAVFFVVGLGHGVPGVAAAGVVAEAVTLAAGLAVIAASERRGPWPSFAEWASRAAFRARTAVDFDLVVRTVVLIAAFAWFARRGAAQGAVVLAANAVLEKFFLFASYFLDGFAAAAETFVGRAVGARDRAGFDRAVRSTLVGAVVLAGFAALVLASVGPRAVAWMTASREVADVADAHLAFAAATPLVGALAFEMDGVFIGATWTRPMAVAMVAGLALFVAATAVFVPLSGNAGLWWAFLGFLAFRGVALAALLPGRAAATFAGAAGRSRPGGDVARQP